MALPKLEFKDEKETNVSLSNLSLYGWTKAVHLSQNPWHQVNESGK